MSDGVNSGNGQVTITYDPSTDRCRSSHDDDDDPDHEMTIAPAATVPVAVTAEPKFTG